MTGFEAFLICVTALVVVLMIVMLVDVVKEPTLFDWERERDALRDLTKED